jgi:hypothetical protein
LLERLCRPALRCRAACTLCALLSVVGLVGATCDVWRPYKTPYERYVRDLVADFRSHVRPDELIVLGNVPEYPPVVFQWYLGLDRPDVVWFGSLHSHQLAGRSVWMWYFTGSPYSAADVIDELHVRSQVRSVKGDRYVLLPVDSPGYPRVHATLLHLDF